MKSRLLATAFIATLLPLATHANQAPHSCRFINEEIRQRAVVRIDPWSAGLVALDRGDIKAAQSNFELALEATPGDAALITLIASLYLQGSCGLPKDFGKAAAIYSNGAARGDGGAMLKLAIMRWHGQGGREDRAAAVHLFRLGAMALGIIGGKADVTEVDELIDGQVPPALVDELDWVQQLVTTPGMARTVADKLLAEPSPDYVSACRYMALAFEVQPDPETAYRLGMMHLQGRGILSSASHGYRYLARAATGRHAEATAEIGRRMLRGGIPAAEDWNALAWLFRAANMGVDVESDLRAAKRQSSAAAVKEGEMQAHFLPPITVPPSFAEKPCQPKAP